MSGITPYCFNVQKEDEDLLCGRCHQTWAKPVELKPCSHIQCRGCTEGTTHCATCQVAITETVMPHPVLLKTANKVIVQCEDCGLQMSRQDSYAHHCPPRLGGASAGSGTVRPPPIGPTAATVATPPMQQRAGDPTGQAPPPPQVQSIVHRDPVQPTTTRPQAAVVVPLPAADPQTPAATRQHDPLPAAPGVQPVATPDPPLFDPPLPQSSATPTQQRAMAEPTQPGMTPAAAPSAPLQVSAAAQQPSSQPPSQEQQPSDHATSADPSPPQQQSHASVANQATRGGRRFQPPQPQPRQATPQQPVRQPSPAKHHVDPDSRSDSYHAIAGQPPSSTGLSAAPGAPSLNAFQKSAPSGSWTVTHTSGARVQPADVSSSSDRFAAVSRLPSDQSLGNGNAPSSVVSSQLRSSGVMPAVSNPSTQASQPLGNAPANVVPANGRFSARAAAAAARQGEATPTTNATTHATNSRGPSVPFVCNNTKKCQTVQQAHVTFQCSFHPNEAIQGVDDHQDCVNTQATLKCTSCQNAPNVVVSYPDVCDPTPHVVCSCANESKAGEKSEGDTCQSALIAMTGCAHRLCLPHLTNMIDLALRETRDPDTMVQHMHLVNIAAQAAAVEPAWVITCRVCHSLGLVGVRAGYVDPRLVAIHKEGQAIPFIEKAVQNIQAKIAAGMVYCGSCAALTPRDKHNGKCGQCGQVPCAKCTLSRAHCLHTVEKPMAGAIAHTLAQLLHERVHVRCGGCLARLPSLPAIAIDAHWSTQAERNLVPCYRCHLIACGICGAVGPCNHERELKQLVEDDCKAAPAQKARASTRPEVVYFYRCVALCRAYFAALRQHKRLTDGVASDLLRTCASFPVLEVMWRALGWCSSVGELQKAACMAQHYARKESWRQWVEGAGTSGATAEWMQLSIAEWEEECVAAVQVLLEESLLSKPATAGFGSSRKDPPTGSSSSNASAGIARGVDTLPRNSNGVSGTSYARH